jgi:hypothetical protein
VNRSELDDFLFASIGDEESGMTLSVVSALARLGFDPWREAARLAALPKPQAIATLAGLFDRLPRPGDRQHDEIGQATRLIDLLPSVPLVVAGVSTGLRRRRLPFGFGGICLVLVIAAIAFTLAGKTLVTHDEATHDDAPPTAFATRP